LNINNKYILNNTFKYTIFLLLFFLQFILTDCTSVSRFNQNATHTSYAKTGSAPIGMTFRGWASYYSNDFHNRKTSSGELYDKDKLSAAHRDLPFGTKLKVTNLKNGKSVVVVVNDRGPFVANRIIDLSYRAAKEIDMIKDGITEVQIEVLE
jgi:rare lipoprotein A (peptidoglycan hydrolase)